MSAFTDFVAKYTGIANTGDTPQNQGECVGLVEVWLDTLGINIPHIYGNAIDLLSSMGAEPNNFTIIQNTLTNFPGEGDVVILGKPYGQTTNADGSISYLGHCGVATANCSANVLELFEANDPDGSAPQIKQYTYDSVQGWGHPLILNAQTEGTAGGSPTANVSVTDQQITDQLNAEIAAVNACQLQLKEANTQITGLQASLTTANSQVSDLQDQVKTLQSENIALTNASKTLNSNYAASQSTIISLKNQIVANQNEDIDYAKETLTSSQIVTELQNDLQKIAAMFDIATSGLTYDQITQKILTEQEAEESLAKNAHISLQVLQELGHEVITRVEDMGPVQLGQQLMAWIRSKKYQSPTPPSGEGSKSLLQKLVSLFYTQKV